MRKPRFPLHALLAGALATVLAASLGATVTSTPARAADTVLIQAEAYAAQSGVQLEATGDTGGGQNAAYLAGGDWMRFDNVDLGAAGPLTVSARVASAVGGAGSVELRTGSPTGPLLAQFDIAATGGWQSWATRSVDVAAHPTGPQSVFAVMRSSGAGDFVNVNWFSFAAGSSPGWVKVDQAKWDAQLAAFRAMTPAPVPANDMPGMVSADTLRRAGVLSGAEFDRVFAAALRAHLTQSLLLCAGERASGGAGEARELAGELERAGSEQLVLLDSARSGKS